MNADDRAFAYADAVLGTVGRPSGTPHLHSALVQHFHNALIEAYNAALTDAKETTTSIHIRRSIEALRK